jgi:hypothetical protein
MPVTTCALYVKSLLNGITPPGATGVRSPIQAFITPLTPDVNPDGIARVYVWPASGPERRRAMPRNTGPSYTTAGVKQIIHDLQVFLVWMDNPDDQNADINFPLLIDYVMFILRTSPNPDVYTDAVTGFQSSFVNVGEDMSYEFIPPHALEPDAMRRYDSRIRVRLLELFQA